MLLLSLPGKRKLRWLTGRAKDIEGFVLGMRWANYLIRRPAGPLWIAYAGDGPATRRSLWDESDEFDSRWTLAVGPEGILEGDGKATYIVHYGDATSLRYAAAGIRYAVKNRWAVRVNVDWLPQRLLPKLRNIDASRLGEVLGALC